MDLFDPYDYASSDSDYDDYSDSASSKPDYDDLDTRAIFCNRDVIDDTDILAISHIAPIGMNQTMM